MLQIVLVERVTEPEDIAFGNTRAFSCIFILQLNMAAVRAGFAVLCVGVLIYGILDLLTNFEDNKCEMTFMFEMPEYVVCK